MVKRSILILMVFAVAGPVNAQVLEEIIVTAQKREQNIQDVGIAITAFSGEQMRQLGYTNAQQITALAPGVHTVQPNGEANYALAIRGAANSDFVANQESPVSMYVDEVYISQMSGAGFMLFDMERVEILRGPQGTLYGRNATGGLAHFVTNKPEQEFGGYGQVTVGEYDQVKFQGAVTGALTEGLSARLSVSTHHNSGYVENRLDPGNDLNNANDYAGRMQLLFEPNEDFSLLLNARYSLQEIRTGFFENVSGSLDEVGNGVKEDNCSLYTNFNGYCDGDGDNFAGDYDKLGHNDLETYGFTGTMKWQLGDNLLTVIMDRQGVERDYIEDSDASPHADFNFFLNTDAEQWSTEVRLDGETDRLRWVAGYYYLDIDIADANGAEIPGLGTDSMGTGGNPVGVGNFEAFGFDPVSAFLAAGLFGLSGPALGLPDPADAYVGVDNPYQQQKDSWSLFGQLEYELNEQFTVIGGFRWIDETVDFHYESNVVWFPNDGSVERNGNPNIAVPTAAFIEILGYPPLSKLDYDGEYSEGLWSAKVELDWRPNDNLLAYASWNRGVKGGGFNAPLNPLLVLAQPQGVVSSQDEFDVQFSFGEEELNAFEVGFKSSLMDGLARFNASAYYNDYKDFQAFTIVSLATNVVSAPDAESIGFETELFLTPAEGLDVAFGLSYNDMDVTLADGSKTTSIQSPKWNVNGLVRYEWPAFNGGSMAIQGDIHYRSKHHHSVTRADAVTENGYHIANARLSYTSAGGKWEAAVFAENITDENYVVQSFDIAAVLGWIEEYYGRPRWVGGSIAYHF